MDLKYLLAEYINFCFIKGGIFVYFAMPVIYDALVIFVIVYNVICSYKQGFIQSVLSIINYFISFFIAGFFGKFLSGLIFDGLIKSGVEKNLLNILNDSAASGDLFGGIDKISDLIPSWFKFFSSNQKSISDASKNFILQNDFNAAAGAISNEFFRPYAIMLISSILFFILFAVIRLVFKKIYKLNNFVQNIPVVGGVNNLLGGFCGVIKAGIILFVVAIIAFIIILMTGNEMNLLNSEIINKTNLFFMFYKFIPFTR